MNKFTNVLAIHCHTTGMNFNGPKTEGHQPLTVSLSVFDLDQLTVVDSITVNVAYDPSIVEWNESLEAIHGLSRDTALAGDNYNLCAAELGGFIATHFGTNKKIPLFGFNVNNFHLPFLEQILHSEELYFKFDERSIDLFPMATLMGKFSVYDAIESLIGKVDGPISSPQFIKHYIKMYKMLRAMISEFTG